MRRMLNRERKKKSNQKNGRMLPGCVSNVNNNSVVNL